ncbi:MAG: hypothetical protein HQK53_15080, partial [Oligoflexia bacterium]|nr:hypothetical protein [Oligoflexia bacterium]
SVSTAIYAGGIKPYNNGWYRLWAVANNNNYANATPIEVRIYPAYAISDSMITSNSPPTPQALATGSMYFFGAQLENGYVPSSYIYPTPSPYSSIQSRVGDSISYNPTGTAGPSYHSEDTMLVRWWNEYPLTSSNATQTTILASSTPYNELLVTFSRATSSLDFVIHNSPTPSTQIGLNATEANSSGVFTLTSGFKNGYFSHSISKQGNTHESTSYANVYATPIYYEKMYIGSDPSQQKGNLNGHLQRFIHWEKYLPAASQRMVVP